MATLQLTTFQNLHVLPCKVTNENQVSFIFIRIDKRTDLTKKSLVLVESRQVSGKDVENITHAK